MGSLKQRYLEGLKIEKETEVSLQEYQGDKKFELTDEEQKLLDDIIDCQIEDIKFKRDEINLG